VTLRQRLGPDVQRIYDQVDDLLDSEDAIIILADAHRAIHYARGFGLSACQHELLAVEIDRSIRAMTQAEAVESVNPSLNVTSLEGQLRRNCVLHENGKRTSRRRRQLACAGPRQ
jgi:hypothetical protein